MYDYGNKQLVMGKQKEITIGSDDCDSDPERTHGEGSKEINLFDKKIMELSQRDLNQLPEMTSNKNFSVTREDYESFILTLIMDENEYENYQNPVFDENTKNKQKLKTIDIYMQMLET